MKIREIDRHNYLKNSPLKRLVNIGTFVIVGATSAYGGYLVYYNPESIKSKVNFLLGVFNFDKLSEDPSHRIKATDRKVQANSFKQYLEEKKANRSALEEDTRRRLERLRNPAAQSSTKQEPPSPPPEPAVVGKSRVSRLVDYTKSWYRWIRGSPPPPSPPVASH